MKIRDAQAEKRGPSTPEGVRRGPAGPQRGSNSGTYRPASLSMGKKDLIKGLKGLSKIKHPNRHMSSTAYKTGLKKVAPDSPESEG